MISQAIFRKFCLLLLALEGCECKRNWDYDPISLTGHSSDEVGFSGTLDWQYYHIIGNTTMGPFALPKKPASATKAVYEDLLF
ncbi:uncharacterized protein Dvir_GJ26447 [Drosophila virilis]|uniref:Uncharacterized protein n=1 Tax=Drosophila virilis TaxID=7244 RepID=A0A0Q9WSR9_DROVI|nr:uncharacterized protein Dvir_GJ26447 [Drosophila virilis]